MSIERYSKRLPGYLQTDPNKKFLSATIDQLLSERQSEKLDGFVGRRVGGCYDPNDDFYINELTRSRLNYHLEPIALSKNPDTLENSNEVFYEDFLNSLKFYGSNITNHDRLFASDYYSFAPPIDMDKFLNYHNYFWVKDFNDLPIIDILGYTEAQIDTNIIGQTSFNTDDLGVGLVATYDTDGDAVSVDGTVNDPGEITINITSGGSGYGGNFTIEVTDVGGGTFDVTFTVAAGVVTSGTASNLSGIINDIQNSINIPLTPEDLEFTSGLVVRFKGSAAGKYEDIVYRVECVGRNMILVPELTTILPGDQFESLLWDFNADTSTNSGPEPWDTLPWDCTLRKIDQDYMTIERGSCDHNGWSRTNAWYHEDVLQLMSQVTGQDLPASATRAERPIIEFKKDLELHKSGNTWIADVRVVAGCTDFDEEASLPTSCTSFLSFSDIDGQAEGLTVDGVQLADGDLIMFLFPSDAGGGITASHYIWQVSIVAGLIQLDRYPTPGSILTNGEIVIVQEGAIYKGRTYRSENLAWKRVSTEKLSENDPPRFELYDCNDVALCDESIYPDSNYSGSEIFSYRVNSDSDIIDDILGIPLLFTGLGQISDIVFDHDLVTDRYSYVVDNQPVEIEGYYFYNCLNADSECNFTPEKLTTWQPAGTSKQRVIDRYVIKDVTKVSFDLSVLPYQNDTFVKVDGIVQDPTSYTIDNDKIVFGSGFELDQVLEFFTYSRETSQEIFTVTDINQREYQLSELPHYEGIGITITGSTTGVITSFRNIGETIIIDESVLPLTLSETITIDYTSSVNLPDTARGYYEIPQSLESNPTNEEITSHSYNDFVQHFLSIIENQSNIVSVTLGESNLYRDSSKDLSKGEFILQNVSSVLKSMFVSSDDTVNFVKSIRFASQEYERFKNKFIKTTFEMFNNGELSSVIDPDNNVQSDQWFNDILNRIKQTTEVYNTFLYSYMVSAGTVYQEELLDLTGGVDDGNGNITVDLTIFDDIDDLKNTLQIIIQDTDASPLGNGGRTILEGSEYIITSTASPISVQIQDSIASDASIDQIYARIYSNPISQNIPATPSKLGLWPVFSPKIVTDMTIPTPQTSTGVQYLIGHDGSRTPLFGDIRDTFLLELETRIYNGICQTLKDGYQPFMVLEDVYPGKFRDTNWTTEEFFDVIKPSFSKWSNTQRVNWRENDTFDNSDEWTYNYQDKGVNEVNTPGYWRGIYTFYYDTITPHLTPWELLGFVDQPSWWETTYGTDYSSSNALMWGHLEIGFIASGDRQGVDSRYVRAGLVASYLPVDGSANLLTPFQIGLVVDPATILDEDKERDWKIGDNSPAENAWMDTSNYPFAMVEALYLMQPAKFSNLAWDSKDIFRAPVDEDQIVSLATCKRPKLTDQYVHGETLSNEIQVRLGYQQWISDRILFLRKSIKNEFGEKIRKLNVKLGHKMGGYTIDDNFKLFSESVSPGSTSTTQLLPSENIDVKIKTSPSIEDLVYSGVIVRALTTGQYQIYGYDLLDCVFKFLPPLSNTRNIEVKAGADDAEFRPFLPERTYLVGDIVKYNTIFYRAVTEHFATTFDPSLWVKLSSLPSTGGVAVTYKPDRDKNTIITYDYGHVFDTVDEVFDFLIGYGAYLENNGWVFDTVNVDTSTIQDFLEIGKQFLFWVATNWAPDQSIALSPAASRPKLRIEHGYPANVEKANNGVYSILDEEGVVIDPRLTVINRSDELLANGKDIVQLLEVIPKVDDVSIYYLRVSVTETEHIVVVDNLTTFNDVIFDPALGLRQQRLELSAFRSLCWTGKYEAPGYVITDTKQLIPNIENTTESMRRYHDSDTALDISRVEDTARHLIGYEEKSYLVDLELDDDVQYQFYQGSIREKGTSESIKKLLRSVYVRRDQDITTFEEWALRVSKYGANCNNQRIDLLIRANDVKTDPQIVILDTPKTRTGHIKEILVLDTEMVYDSRPNITIIKASGDPGNGGGGEAVAVLASDNTLLRIDVTNPGCGYILEPLVYIGDSAWDDDDEPWDTISWDSGSTDKALAVLQKEIVEDPDNDDLLIIDMDDTDRWIHRPRTCGPRDLWPTTDNITYEIPNAGYAHINDVDFTAFDLDSFYELWGEASAGAPKIEQTATYDTQRNLLQWTAGNRETVWIAKSVNADWNVYRVVDTELRTGQSFILSSNNIGTVIETSTALPTDENDLSYIPSTIVLNVRTIVQTEPLKTTIDNQVYKISPTGVTGTTYANQYQLLDTNDNPVQLTQALIDDIESSPSVIGNIWYFVSARFKTSTERDNFLNTFLRNEELTWIDEDDNGRWSVQLGIFTPYPWDLDVWDNDDEPWDNEEPYFWNIYNVDYEVNGTVSSIPRQQEDLVDTPKFKQGFLYDSIDEETIFMMPVYDPFKGILPGVADQNIDFKTETDPARYTTASNESLVDTSNLFLREEEGRLWWDLSTARYFYYEQGTNRERRDQWGRLFPGSEINVYEWTRSTRLPGNYVGEGTVRNETDYAQTVEFDESLNKEVNVYYFWVKGKTSVPDLKNRTLSSQSIELLLNDPRNQNYQWFSPINHHKYEADRERARLNLTWQTGQDRVTMPVTFFEDEVITVDGVVLSENIDYTINKQVIIFNLATNKAPSGGSAVQIDYLTYVTLDDRNAFIFNNVNKQIANIDSVLQINFSYSDNDNLTHGEWYLMRDGDDKSVVLDQHWNKMVDSLIGQTDIIPWTDDVPGFCQTEPGMGFLLVPDPTLSEAERYGTEYRPRQTWFKSLENARKIFVAKANNLISEICIRDEFPDWETTFGSSGSDVWQWADWFADGWTADTVNPTRQVNDTVELLSLSNKVDGEIIKVVDSTDPSALFTNYVYSLENDEFTVISREDCTIEFQDILFNDISSTVRNFELRSLIEFLEENIFVNEYLVKKNQLFFTLLTYSVSEFDNMDWVFMSTYLLVNQEGFDLNQNKFFTIDPIESTIDYVNFVKPYRSKVRDYTITRNVSLDLAPGTAQEIRDMKITLIYNRVACSGWDIFDWDEKPWDNEMFDVPEWGCPASDFIRDARFFPPSTVPWDFGNVWDECPWDGDINENYYSASDPMAALADRFDQIEADQTETSDGIITTYTLSFTPTTNELGPYVFLNGVQYYNFTYDDTTPSITFIDTPTNGDIIEIYDVLPFDGSGFLQPAVREDVPEELVPVESHEILVITVDRDPLRCIGEAGTGTIYWIPDSNVDTGTITVEIDGAPLDPANFTIVSHMWDDYEWDPDTHCDGPPWDVDFGVQIDISLSGGEQIIINYDYTVGTIIPEFKMKLFRNEFDQQKIFRLLDDESGTLQQALLNTDDEIIIENVGTEGFNDNVSLTNPGFVWINDELIAYHEYELIGMDVYLRNLVRGYNGTVVSASHALGDTVYDAQGTNEMASINNTLPSFATGDFTLDQLLFLGDTYK